MSDLEGWSRLIDESNEKEEACKCESGEERKLCGDLDAFVMDRQYLAKIDV